MGKGSSPAGVPDPGKAAERRPKPEGCRGKRNIAGPVTLPGGLLRIYNIGVLITGDSGVGKSESALELVARGHRFVTDDVVKVTRKTNGTLVGRAPSIGRDFMEIRGLGIINIREIFGPRAVFAESAIDLVITLRKWSPSTEKDRLGLRFPDDFGILGVAVPQLNIPVAPGRNMATLIEVACKVHLLRQKGYHASREIVRRLNRSISAKRRRGGREER